MIKWTPKSELDLDEIREYIAKDFNSTLAIKIVNDLIDFVESTLEQNPLAGAIVESNPLFSHLVFEGNLIFYCENPRDRHLYIVYVQPRKMRLKKNRISSKEIA